MFIVENVSVPSILVATFASMLIGMIWYNPHVFGGFWMELTGQKQCKNMGQSMLTGLVATFISTYFLAVLIAVSGTTRLTEAAMLAGLVWLAGSMPGELHGVAWEHRPISLFAINAAQSLVSLIAVAIILQMSTL